MPQPKKKIDPAVAKPQAPLALRAGPKAKAAASPSAPPAKSEEGDDNKDPDDEGDDADDADDLAARQAAHDETADAAVAAYRAAADAAEATKGTDSASVHQAGETAHDAAMEAGAAFKSSCMAMRGAEEQPPDSQRQGMPLAPPAPSASARAVAALGGPSASAQMTIAEWAAFGREMAGHLKATTIVQARALGPEAAAALAELPKIQRELAKRDVRDTLAAACHAGMPREKAFAIDKDGKVGDPLPKWLKMGAEDVAETVATMGFPPGAPVSRSTLIIGSAGGGDEAGLAARAAAAGVDIETRRRAEANIHRSQQQEHAR